MNEYGSTENLAENSEMPSVMLDDINLLQQLKLRVQELEDENQYLKCRGNRSETPSKNASQINLQILHRVIEDDEDGEDGMDFLSRPDWETHDGAEFILRGRFPVSDPEGYVEKKGNIAFIVYKYYKVEHQRVSVEYASKKNIPIPDPEPVYQKVVLQSDEMKKAVDAFFAQSPTFGTDFPEARTTHPMASPFLWWYHSRNSHGIRELPLRQAELVTTLTGWIEANYSTSYDQVNDQFRRDRVSRLSMEYLIRPGDVLVAENKGAAMGYHATSRPFLVEDSPGRTSPLYLRQVNEQHKPNRELHWRVRSYSFEYAGNFSRKDVKLELTLDDEAVNGETDFSSLEAIPLKYASQEIRKRLERRGQTFWKCRHKQLVSYEERGDTRNHTGQRYMIDFNTYKELHPQHDSFGKTQETTLPTDGSKPNPPEIYLFPSLLIGFDLRRKKWTDLEVDQIRDVTWNDQAFSSLVADEDMKELIRALVTSQLAAEKGTDLIDNKGNGLIMLLHGSPGTGKTFTAESVAEIAKKPLFPVTCGDIGTKPDVVEKYLESVFHLGKIWGCVVLLDEAEVFLEQRSLSDLDRNALVSVFLRALEYYEGILILTTNRVGTFDEAFKSRIQLALQYDNLDEQQRSKIWRNFIQRLRKVGGEDEIDFEDIVNHTGDLAKHTMNGRQIRNSITTARQLAKFQKKKMTHKHLERAIMVAEKFDRHLADVRESRTEKVDQRVNERYTDDYLAREAQIR